MRELLPSGTPVEVVRPDSPSAGLVVVPDIFGLRQLFDDLVARLSAENGWAVAAFEPFPDQQPPSVEERMGLMPTMHDERWVADAVATADLLGVEPVGILGFCMGGMVTMKAAATGRFHRAVPFYGMVRNPENWQSTTNRDAMDALVGAPGERREGAGHHGHRRPVHAVRAPRRARGRRRHRRALRGRRARLRARPRSPRPPRRRRRRRLARAIAWLSG